MRGAAGTWQTGLEFVLRNAFLLHPGQCLQDPQTLQETIWSVSAGCVFFSSGCGAATHGAGL